MLTNNQIVEKIRNNRTFMKSAFAAEDYISDQQKELPQPPLAKAAADSNQVTLTRDFTDIVMESDYVKLTTERRSHRTYSGDAMTLNQLAFLLWTTQGVKSVRGNNYATIRPVPSGGARHPFETYLAVRSIDGLEQGIYHYLPLTHTLEFIGTVDSFEETLSESLCGQKWAGKANVTFFYSITPYRCEWRYSHVAHKVALLDAGHVMQNLYLSCEAIGCGACAIAAYDQEKCDAMLRLDGEDEFTIYTAPVGIKSETN